MDIGLYMHDPSLITASLLKFSAAVSVHPCCCENAKAGISKARNISAVLTKTDML